MRRTGQRQQCHQSHQRLAHQGKGRQQAQLEQQRQHQHDLRHRRAFAEQARLPLQRPGQQAVGGSAEHDQQVAGEDQQGQPPGQLLDPGQAQVGGHQQQLVGQRIEHGTQTAEPAEAPRQEAIQRIRNPRNEEQQQRRGKTLPQQQQTDGDAQQQAHQRQQVGQAMHGRSLPGSLTSRRSVDWTERPESPAHSAGPPRRIQASRRAARAAAAGPAAHAAARGWP